MPQERACSDADTDRKWWDELNNMDGPIPAKRELSPFNLEWLYRLIDRRYRSKKSTWVTLNVTTEEEADEKLTAPVFDRLRDGAHLFRCFWPSHREQKKYQA